MACLWLSSGAEQGFEQVSVPRVPIGTGKILYIVPA